MKTTLYPCLTVLSIAVCSCSSDDVVLNRNDELTSSINIEKMYDQYSKESKNNFGKNISMFFATKSRSLQNEITPIEFGNYLASLSEEDLYQLKDEIEGKNQNTLPEDYGLDSFIDSVDIYQASEYIAFVHTYPQAENKFELLCNSIKDKPLKLQKTYIASAAAIDNVAMPISDAVASANSVHVGGNGYYGHCEHQFVLDLAQMCVGDVLVEFWGGGPEDVAADVTCGVGDVLDCINAALSYIDCKKGS